MRAKDGKVLSELQRGYMLHDRVLRRAMVVAEKGCGGGENDIVGGSAG